MKKKQWNTKDLFLSEHYGNGLRCVIICALAVILVVGVNLFSAALPTAVTNWDISVNEVHSVSDETRAKIQALEEPVEVFFVCEEGEEDYNAAFLLNLYADLSEHLTVTQIDPAFSPQIVQRYTGSDLVRNNSIIVASSDRQQVLTYSDYFNNSQFVLEDYMNSAIDFVTSDELEKVYMLTGHGEAELGSDTEDYLGLDGFQAEELNLLHTDTIPADAAGVVINGPTADITEREAQILTDYLKGGGHVLLITGYTNSSQSRIQSITKEYGASATQGVIYEGQESHYTEGNQAYLLPNIITQNNDVVTSGVEFVLMPSAKGIELDEDVRDSVETSVFLQTSETAVSMYTNLFTGAQESEEGPFNLGVTFTEDTAGGQTRLLWLSSRYISSENTDAYVGGGNITTFLNSISWVCRDQAVASIHGKTVSTQFLTVTDSARSIWRIVLCGVIPAVVLLLGVVVCVRRRRK